ncbi:ATP-binding protein [Neobacillus dielmonensis]|uniref:ATP-binding protein n=1 Tax=Neobacillus dielmonensis TaxID=1347369 RepID=UPI0005AA1BA9|nr:HAMP domain-containing sensor histidine kinase [Neobacillus dielmonensis]
MEITKHFFFNLSLLMIILFFSLIWVEKKQGKAISKFWLYLWFLALLASCLVFSYHKDNYIYLDLRSIPILIGGLYFGIGPLLCISVIVIRGFYGLDAGFLLNTLLYLSLAFFLWKLHPWFWAQSPRRRWLLTLMAGILLNILTIIFIEIVSPPENRLDAYFAYLVIPSMGLGMISYAVEFVSKNAQMRQELVQTEKLHAVEQMGAAISHEIRNPLTAAIGFVQLLQEHNLTPVKRQEYLSIIRGELESAERVIQDYLTFSKPTLDKIESIDVNRELQQVVKILKPTANKHSAKIITNLAVSSYVYGDRQKFHQCFINVIKNSIESMPHGGFILIETQTTESSISITIKDTGIGMSKEQVQRLGEPYYSTKGSKGTGLGMMVVYSIIRAMEGKIYVESEEGTGTLFRFVLPLRK